MADTFKNRAKWAILKYYVDNHDLRAAVILGTQTGVDALTIGTMAALDAVSGVSFHTERLALTGEAVTQDDVNNRAAFDADDLLFAAAPGVTAQALVVYDHADGTAANQTVLDVYTTGYPQPMDGGLEVVIADLLRLS